MNKRKIELLAPAKTADIGVEAILHGADAVYIGGPAFGARSVATNTIEDIKRLVEFAHFFRAKVYVTLNTILYDNEFKKAEDLIHQLYEIEVDAIIIQDFGVLSLNLPPIPLHASTQMDTYTPERVIFLRDLGFSQIVLARELTLKEIEKCCTSVPNTPIEVFIHGAVCVSYSGRCYASQYNFKRSANRGDCAQFCRLSFDLIDADGKIITKNKHLLSLHDMNRSNVVEDLLHAGVSSFKIEGRLKDVTYVKNITAHYRKLIDDALLKFPNLERSSLGGSAISFTPDPQKSFNRGFSTYFINGRAKGQEAFDTPKAMGEPLGKIKELSSRYFTLKTQTTINNGDGLCFLDSKGKLCGFRVNKVEEDLIYPAIMPKELAKESLLFRNSNQVFEKQLTRPTAERKIEVDLSLYDTDTGFKLTAVCEDGVKTSVELPFSKEIAQKKQDENIKKQLFKWGNSFFKISKIEIYLENEWFLPSSFLASLKRNLLEKLIKQRSLSFHRDLPAIRKREAYMPMNHLTYMANVANQKAHSFLLKHGAVSIDKAMEVTPTTIPKAILMVCKHCLRYSYGCCPKYHKTKPQWKEPIALTLVDGRKFPLAFNCQKCEMIVYAEK